MSIQVTTQTLGPRFSELVLHELDPRYSRVEVTIKANSGPLPVGLVLARGADGVCEPLKEADGSGAALVLPHSVPDAATPQTALALRGYCVINPARLVFDEAVTDKPAALRALEARGFVLRAIEEATHA